MKTIKQKQIVYAIADTLESLEQLDKGRLSEGTKWYGDNSESLQGSRMVYHTGKEFKVHRHKYNPRTVPYTQEVMICLKGKAKIDIYNCDKEFLETITVTKNDIVFLYNGYHGLKIVQDNTILYELKCGRYSSVEKDKEFLNEK